MTDMNTCILLARRPGVNLVADDFAVAQRPIPELTDGQFLIKNTYLSLDAGFRQWMNEGSDDNYLTSMPLNEPVQSIVLGTVVQSRNVAFPEGAVVMGRTSWEQYSIADGSDLMSILAVDPDLDLHEYLCALGPSGMTAYFGLMEVGKPKAGDVFVINAAAGGVGSFAGQIAKAEGCTTVGISGGAEKCQWLRDSLGYDLTIDYKSEKSLDQQLSEVVPDGADIVFDNVGGEMLGTMLGHLAMNARVVLCGMVSQYGVGAGEVGVANLWELITKRAKAEGFMFSDYVDRYGEGFVYISDLLKAGKLTSPVHFTDGIEGTGQAFVDMLEGRSRGKCLIRL